MVLTLLLLAMTPQDRFEAGDPAARLICSIKRLRRRTRCGVTTTP